MKVPKRGTGAEPPDNSDEGRETDWSEGVASSCQGEGSTAQAGGARLQGQSRFVFPNTSYGRRIVK